MLDSQTQLPNFDVYRFWPALQYLMRNLLADRNINPYAVSSSVANDSSNGVTPRPFSIASRLGAGSASMVIFLFALAAYMAWAIADFYSIANETQFYAVLGTTFGLGLIGLFWMFFAIVGHRLIPRTANLLVLNVTGIVAIPACLYVLTFFV